MAMITPVDKIPIQNTQNDNIGDINDPLVKEVIDDIHNSKPIIQQQQQPQQPIYKHVQYQEIEQPINKSYINYDILTKSVILAIITMLIITFLPIEKINEIMKTDEYETITKTIILCIIYYLYNYNINNV